MWLSDPFVLVCLAVLVGLAVGGRRVLHTEIDPSGLASILGVLCMLAVLAWSYVDGLYSGFNERLGALVSAVPASEFARPLVARAMTWVGESHHSLSVMRIVLALVAIATGAAGVLRAQSRRWLIAIPLVLAGWSVLMTFWSIA